MKPKHIFHEPKKEYEMPLNEAFISVCCDCCLAHREIYIIRDGKLFCKSERDKRRTGQFRRYNNIKLEAI